MAVVAEKLPGTMTTSRAIYADKALSVGCGCDRSESGGDRGHPREDKAPGGFQQTVATKHCFSVTVQMDQAVEWRAEEGRRLSGWICLRGLTDMTLFCFLNAIL